MPPAGSPSVPRFVGEDVLLPSQTEDGRLVRGPAAFSILDGRIETVVRGEAAREGRGQAGVTVLEGLVAPGFIDLQVNGGFGVDVALDAEAFEVLARRSPATGVTTLLPTLVSSAEEDYPRLLGRFSQAQSRLAAVAGSASLVGLHLEGPFLAPSRAGAHRPEHLRPIDADWLLGLLDAHPGAVRLVTLAPELAGAPALIRALTARGVRVAAGHTDCAPAAFDQATAAGLTLLTHATNAMPKSLQQGPLAAARRTAALFAGLILDGLHVQPPLLEELLQAFGPGRLFLVTDAAPCAGMPDGLHPLGSMRVRKVGGRVELADDARVLAGSALTLDEAVRNAVRLCRLSIEDAVAMATLVPARAAGLGDRGALRVGARADFVLLHPERLEVLGTWVEGQRAV